MNHSRSKSILLHDEEEWGGNLCSRDDGYALAGAAVWTAGGVAETLLFRFLDDLK
jgi:hypothetical protein